MRRGKHVTVLMRLAMIIIASASCTLVPVIALLVAAYEDTVRDVIHLFNERGLAALDPQWAEAVPARSLTRPSGLSSRRPVPGREAGQPFTRWSLRKLASYLADGPQPVIIGRSGSADPARPRDLLPADPDLERIYRSVPDAKLYRIEYVTSHYPDRCFAFYQFGPLSIRPCHGTCCAPRKHPVRLRATYHRTHGIRYFHGCYSLADHQLWGVTHEHKGACDTLAALKSIRAARPGGYRLFVILDNLSANNTPAIRRWASRENVELCLTPTSASWANPIEAHFGPLRTFVIGTSDHPNHTVLARKLQAYLRWRNAHARHPDVLAAQRRERARIRSERQQRWGHP